MPDKNGSAGAGGCCDNEETEVITDLKEFCTRALTDGLKLFSLLDHPLDENVQETAADSLKSVMEWFLEYDPEYCGDPSDYIEQDPLSDGTADLLSVAQTLEALINLREELPTYGLPQEKTREFLTRIDTLTRTAGGLIGVYFLDESLRCFYDSLGQFNRDADLIALDIVDTLTGSRAP